MVRIRAKPETYFRAYKLPEQPHDEELFQVAFHIQITRNVPLFNNVPFRYKKWDALQGTKLPN